MEGGVGKNTQTERLRILLVQRFCVVRLGVNDPVAPLKAIPGGGCVEGVDLVPKMLDAEGVQDPAIIVGSGGGKRVER